MEITKETTTPYHMLFRRKNALSGAESIKKNKNKANARNKINFADKK